jgi:hypothetical protein
MYKKMSFDTVFESALTQDQDKKRPNDFVIVRNSKRARVTPTTQPTIMSMNGKFNTEPNLVSQQHFFNRQNQEKEYTHVSPWHFPFVQALLQKKTIPNFDMNLFDHIDRYRDSIEGVTRAYEEAYLTDASGDQRKCINEEECEGLKICSEGFVLREFLLPSQQLVYQQTKRYPLDREPCVMCKRLKIAKTVIATRAAGNGLKEDYIIQDYYNFVDLDNEYRLEDCLISKKNTWEGLCNPVVLHQRNNYRFVLKNKRKTYEQWRYPFFRSTLGENPGAKLTTRPGTTRS